MSNLSEEDKKILEKQIAKKVRDELDKEDFEDTAWLKAFSEAKGKKDQAKVFYIDIRSQDLWDSEIEDFELEATAKAKKIRDEQIKTDIDEYLRKGKIEFFNKRQEIDYLTQKESNEYRAAKKRYFDYEKSPDPNEITQHNLDRERLKIIYWKKVYKNKKPKIIKTNIDKTNIKMSSDNLSSKLKKLTKLYKGGTLSKAEFEKAKNNLLK